MNILTILKISRPRFWLYLAGTYLVGYSFGVENINQIPSLFFWIHFFFFLIPANIFLYGINDICDEDTDQHNQKKSDYEHRLLSDEKRLLTACLFSVLGLSFILLSLQPKIESQLLLTLFLLLAFFYSAPPLRLKAKPLLDFSSNILYILPGLFAFYQLTQTLPPLIVLIALFCWSSAMHLFSAIPDISSDKKANLKTTAVVLGQERSLILCTIFWTITFVIALWTTNSYLAIFALIYPLLPLLLLIQKQLDIKKIYKIFPIINTAAGFLLFLYAIL